MLIHSHDDGSTDDRRWRSFVAAQGFGHLVSSGADGDLPVVVPTQFLLADEEIVLHLARSNPMVSRLAGDDRCVMSVAGDWAYIPGSWKAIGDEDPRRGIPTTYYAAVQLSGRAHVVTEPDEVAAVLRQQLHDLEPDGGLIDPAEHGARLRAIVGIRVLVDTVRAKFKYGGNTDTDHRHQVAERLRSRNGPGDRAALSHLEAGDIGG